MIGTDNGTSGTQSGTLRGASVPILELLMRHDEGLTVPQLQKLLSIPRRTIYNNLKKLLRSGVVKKVGTVYECHFQSAHSKMAHPRFGSNIQLHDLSFVVRLVRKPVWWGRRGNRMLRFGMDGVRGVRWGNARYEQCVVGDFVVQCHAQSLIFIASKPFWGGDAWSVFELGVLDFLRVLRRVEELFGFVFFPDGVPVVSVRSSHLVLLRDALGENCKREGSRFEVVIEGKRRLWSDMSDPLGVEAGHADFAVGDMGRYERFVGDVLEREHLLPSEVRERLEVLVGVVEGVARNQEVFGENLVSHVEAVKELAAGVRELRRVVGRLSER